MPFHEGVGKGPNLVKKRRIMEKFFSIVRRVVGGLFVLLALASIVSGVIYSTGAVVVKLLMAELWYAMVCFVFLFLAEMTCDSCDSFAERLEIGSFAVGAFGFVVRLPADMFGLSLLAELGALLAVAGIGLGLLMFAGFMISLIIRG